MRRIHRNHRQDNEAAMTGYRTPRQRTRRLGHEASPTTATGALVAEQ